MAATLARWTPRPVPRTVDGTSLLIGGRETTDTDLHAQSLRCERLLDARGKFSCQLAAPPVVPTVDMDVLFTLEGTAVFGGIVVDLARNGDLWTVTAADNLAICDGLLINAPSPAGTLKVVLDWMVAYALGGYGFTVDAAMTATPGPVVPAQLWAMTSFAAALKQLGILSGWSLTVSPTRVLRMYPGGAVPAPWAINETTDTIQSLTARSSREGHATHVWVRYGSGAPTTVTWAAWGDGAAVSWQSPYYVATPPGTVSVSAVVYPLAPYPPTGGWTGWTWETLDAVGRLHMPAGATPLTGLESATVVFEAAWPSVVVAVDATFPLHTMVVIDYPDVFEYTTAQALADGELARRQGFPQRFTLRTARVGLQPGQTAAIDVPSMDLDTDALVTGVRLVHTQNVGPTGVPWWAFDVELVEANASRGNWLTFWEQLKGGAAGGTGSSVTGTIPPAPPSGGGGGDGAGYATWPLGGDHDSGSPSPTAATWLPIPNACFATAPAAFTGRTWTVYATVKRLLGAGTFQLALTNTASGINAATSAVITFATGEFAAVSFTAPVAPGETYHLRGLTSDAGTIVGVTGYLEAVSA